MSLAKLNDLSLGKKLGASFALLIILAAVIAVISITTLNSYKQHSLVVSGASSAESLLLDARTEEKNFQLRRDQQYLQNTKQLIDQAVETVLPLKDAIASAEDDASLVAAMKRGADATVVGRSSRGTQTSDKFSLIGFTAAVEEAATRCAG
jgi:methyl-accepting chemotaxis protein